MIKALVGLTVSLIAGLAYADISVKRDKVIIVNDSAFTRQKLSEVLDFAPLVRDRILSDELAFNADYSILKAELELEPDGGNLCSVAATITLLDQKRSSLERLETREVKDQQILDFECAEIRSSFMPETKTTAP